MPIINPTLPQNGDDITEDSNNNPLIAILSLLNGNIDTDNLKAGAVTTADIAAGAVTNTKLSTSAINIGHAEITSPFTHTTPTAFVGITGLSVTVTVPSGGRRVQVTCYLRGMRTSATAGTALVLGLFEGATQIADLNLAQVGGNNLPATLIASFVPSAGSHTYNVAGFQGAAGTFTADAASTAKGILDVDLK